MEKYQKEKKKRKIASRLKSWIRYYLRRRTVEKEEEKEEVEKEEEAEYEEDEEQHICPSHKCIQSIKSLSVRESVFLDRCHMEPNLLALSCKQGPKMRRGRTSA